MTILSFGEKECRPIGARHLQKRDFKTKTNDRVKLSLAIGP